MLRIYRTYTKGRPAPPEAAAPPDSGGGGGETPSEYARITDNGSSRVTDDGQERVIV